MAECSRTIIGSPSQKVQVARHQQNGADVAYALETTEVDESSGRSEPFAKVGNAIVHSFVVAVSNHSSVCSDKKAIVSNDKSSGGSRQIRKFVRLGQLSIMAAHDADFLKRDR